MKKIYKYGFWILLITTFTLFNFWHITKTGCEKDTAKCKEINEKRISSLFLSNTILKRQIEIVDGKNIITNKQTNNLLKDTTIVILLSDFKCGKCQEKELKRLNKLQERKDLKNIKIIGITTKAKKNQVAVQRKILKLNFPIYWVDDETFFNKLAFADEFPQILFVADGIVISAFKPITMDDEFSENYYKNMKGDEFGLLDESGVNYNLTFVCEKLNSDEKIQNIIESFECEVYPYFNGSNSEYIEQCLSFSINDLFEDVIDMKTLIQNNYMNTNLFGKLIFLPSGEVKVSNNSKIIGNIYEQDILDILLQNKKWENDWKILRKNYEPCNNCIYQNICPPVSDYELVLNKYDFCSN